MEPYTRRLRCLTCKKWITVYFYPNGFCIPACRCDGWFAGTPPFRLLREVEFESMPPKYQAEYFWAGPLKQQQLDEFNAAIQKP